MHEKVSAWLKGSRDYSMGVALYVAYGTDMKLKHALLQGKNPFNEKRLLAELQAMVDPPAPGDTSPVVHFTATPVLQQVANTPTHPVKLVAPPTALFAAVQQEAHTAWKELMNKRALLFSLCQTDGFQDENDPARVQLRGRVALDILQFHKKVVLPAYDKLDHVRATGTLPKVTNVEEVKELDFAALPDHQVKRTIDNLRKNLNKMRKREPTPERLALIATHEANLAQLLKRWDSLK